ncbi:MAG: ribbon-helix-helix domain-containing protein [Candidatus Bathyarchaeia archaeon]
MNTRIGIRINQKEREQLEALIKAGKFKTISDIVRTAIKRLLETET